MIREVQPGEGALVAEVLHELRPHRRADEIPALVDAQRAEGYRVVGSFVDGSVVAGAGISTTWGRGRELAVQATPAPCSSGSPPRRSASAALTSTWTQRRTAI